MAGMHPPGGGKSRAHLADQGTTPPQRRHLIHKGAQRRAHQPVTGGRAPDDAPRPLQILLRSPGQRPVFRQGGLKIRPFRIDAVFRFLDVHPTQTHFRPFVLGAARHRAGQLQGGAVTGITDHADAHRFLHGALSSDVDAQPGAPSQANKCIQARPMPRPGAWPGKLAGYRQWPGKGNRERTRMAQIKGFRTIWEPVNPGLPVAIRLV